MSWIVAETRRLCEHLAKWNLEEQGYVVYLPLAVEPGSNKPEPFFPRYVFVDTAPNHGMWRPIRSTRGVIRVLQTGEAPSVVPAKVIHAMHLREEAGIIRLKARERATEAMQAAKTFEPGQPLRIHEGPYTGFDAVFERIAAGDRVRVLLDCFGGVTPIDVPAEAVSPTRAA